MQVLFANAKIDMARNGIQKPTLDTVSIENWKKR